MTKKIPIGFAITITLLAMTATVSVTMLVAMNIFNSTVEAVTERENMFSKLSELDRVVRNNNFAEINEQLLMDALSTGYMVGISDNYARYYTTGQYAEYLALRTGEIIGIGVDVAVDATGYMRVIRVVQESPAAEAAMDVGSVIKNIGGTDLRGIPIDTVNALMRGAQGSEVEIIWQPSGATEDKTTVLHRRSYTRPTIEFTANSQATGYINVLQFNETLASELDYAINSLRNEGSTGIVLDLRGVTQTSMDNLARVADIFLPAGDIATLQYADETTEQIYVNNDAAIEMPIVVLVDSTTVGAPELLAITLRDFAGARVVGETTAGLSSVSEIFQLSDGSAIEMTVANIVPNISGNYAETGVPLDFEVLLTAEQELYSYNLTFGDDPQYLKAVEMLNTLKVEEGIELTPEEQLTIPDDLIGSTVDDVPTVELEPTDETDNESDTESTETSDTETSDSEADDSEADASSDSASSSDVEE